VFSAIEDLVRQGMALPDAIERVAFPDFVPPEPGAPDFHGDEFGVDTFGEAAE
jgi:conjugal transfer ATP-binding protein TraC